jgi:hypothetical protein
MVGIKHSLRTAREIVAAPHWFAAKGGETMATI